MALIGLSCACKRTDWFTLREECEAMQAVLSNWAVYATQFDYFLRRSGRVGNFSVQFDYFNHVRLEK